MVFGGPFDRYKEIVVYPQCIPNLESIYGDDDDKYKIETLV